MVGSNMTDPEVCVGLAESSSAPYTVECVGLVLGSIVLIL